MKNRSLTKVLALILCLLIVIPAVASCANDEEAGTETSGTTAPTGTTPVGDKNEGDDEDDVNIDEILSSSDYKIVIDDGASDYVIVYPAGAQTEQAVAEALKEKLEEETGAVLEVKDDSAAETAKEILIGNTSRSADDGILEGVKIGDYVVKVSGDKLLIAAYDVECYEMAWKRAVLALNVTEADGKYYAYFKVDYSYQRNGEYTADDLTVDGNSISKYVIVYGDELEKDIAESVQLMIQSACGYVLPVKMSTLASEAAELEIIVGDATGRLAADLETANTYEFKAVGKLLVFYFTNDASGKTAVMEYEAKLEELIKGGNTEIKGISVSGVKANSNAGEVITSMNFNGLTATTDSAAALSAAGINVLYENNWNPDNTTATNASITADGKLKLNGGGTAYEIASANKFIGVSSFTLQFELTVETLGVMEVLFTKSHTAYSNIEGSSVMFRDYPTTDATANFNGGGALNSNNLGYLTQYISGGNKANIGANQTNIGAASAYNKAYKVVIEFAMGESISVSIYDGASKVGDTRTVTSANGTICDGITSVSIRLQNAPVIIDNVILSNGTYADYKSANA